MNDIGKELYERVSADFERRLAAEKRLPRNMPGVSDYSARVGRYLAEAIAANVTEDALPDGRLYYNIAKSILEPSLRTNYELVNDTAAEVQRLLDEKQGLHIKPARPDFPAERVGDVIGAASEEGIDFDRALRRMTSPAENITQSFADDFMQANAEQRSKAGFDTFIERQGGVNCCPWCAGLVGRFSYPNGLPKEVFARHDNCTCSVTYGTKGGARQNVWTKAKWNVPPIEEPHRMTAEEAAAKGAFAEPRRLTGGANGGILNYRDSGDSLFSITEQVVRTMPSVGFLSGEPALKYDSECKNLLTYAMNSGYDTGTEFSIILDENMNRIDGHGYVIGQKGSTPIDDYHKPYHALHNHGSDETLSIRDLSNFLRRKNQKSITAIGNRGSRYVLSETDKVQSTRYYVYVVDQSNRVFFTTSQGVDLKLKDFTDETRKVRTSPLVNGLPETEIEEIKKALVNKTREVLIGGEKYGYKYYEKRASD